MLDAGGRLQPRLHGILIVQGLENTEHCRLSVRISRGEPSGTALAAQ